MKIEKWTFIEVCILICIVASIVFTRFFLLDSVPGFHFDEAWQGLYAQRILTEPDFWPLKAMNAYTSPVVHYILSIFFKWFSTSLFVMRSLFVGFHIISLAIFFLIFNLLKQKQASLWFLVITAFLPAMIHTSRFAIEMNGFHNFCLSLVALGLVFLSLDKQKKILGTLFMTLGLQLGSLSHIIFIPVVFSLVFIFILERKKLKKNHLYLLVINLFLLLPLLSEVHFSMKKWSTLGLVLVLVIALQAGLLFIMNEKIWICFQNFKNIERVSQLGKKILYLIAIPYSFYFFVLLFDGSFAYGQVTGFQALELKYKIWLPINGILFLILIHQIFKVKNIKYSKISSLTFIFFIILFVFTSVMIFKQTPRYYSNVLIVFCFWLALLIAEFKFKKIIFWVCCITFISWNSYAFFYSYVLPFKKYGAKDKEFHFLIYKDSPRDFRAFQKVYSYLKENGCQNVLQIVEDDRFLRPIQFLRLNDPSAAHCKWNETNILFLHIPEDRAQWHKDIQLIANEESWGDLALWQKK